MYQGFLDISGELWSLFSWDQKIPSQLFFVYPVLVISLILHSCSAMVYDKDKRSYTYVILGFDN